MTNTHTADAAGGEAIYSSDGLSPLQIPPPPSSLPSTHRRNTEAKNDDNDTELIYTERNDVVRAFEVFSGKVFAPAEKRSSASKYSYPKQDVRKESRLERLARIQAELEEMEEDHSRCSRNNDDDLGEEEVMGVVKDMSARLQVLLHGVDVTKRQTDLTLLVNNLSLEGAKEEEEEEGHHQQTRQNQHQHQHQHQHKGSLTQEQRILRIENALGSQLNSGNAHAHDVTILQRLKEAEEKLNSIDEKSLNQAASRAKVIR